MGTAVTPAPAEAAGAEDVVLAGLLVVRGAVRTTFAALVLTAPLPPPPILPQGGMRESQPVGILYPIVFFSSLQYAIERLCTGGRKCPATSGLTACFEFRDINSWGAVGDGELETVRGANLEDLRSGGSEDDGGTELEAELEDD